MGMQIFESSGTFDPKTHGLKVGDVVVSAFVADLRDGQFARQQQLAGVSDA